MHSLKQRHRRCANHGCAGRHGLQMYLGRPRLFNDRAGRRWFIAEQEGKVIGFLSMLRVGCTECQDLINIVFSSPAAPLYTNELMVATALQALREEGVRFGLPRGRAAGGAGAD